MDSTGALASYPQSGLAGMRCAVLVVVVQGMHGARPSQSMLPSTARCSDDDSEDNVEQVGVLVIQEFCYSDAGEGSSQAG